MQTLHQKYKYVIYDQIKFLTPEIQQSQNRTEKRQNKPISLAIIPNSCAKKLLTKTLNDIKSNVSPLFISETFLLFIQPFFPTRHSRTIYSPARSQVGRKKRYRKKLHLRDSFPGHLLAFADDSTPIFRSLTRVCSVGFCAISAIFRASENRFEFSRFRANESDSSRLSSFRGKRIALFDVELFVVCVCRFDFDSLQMSELIVKISVLLLN